MALPRLITKIPGPKSRQYLKRLRKHECAHVTFSNNNFPIFIQKSNGNNVIDADGNRYLDFTSFFGVSHLGHASKNLAQSMKKVIDQGWHSMGDVHPHVLKANAAKALASILPQSLSQAFFSSSGSEAVETALKTALMYTGKPGVVAFEGSYHGLGYGALQVTHRKHFREPFKRQSKMPVTFWKFISEGNLSRQQVNQELGRLDSFLRKAKEKIGAMIIEPIQGRGGIRVADPLFLKGIRKLCRRYGILLIFDEIYSGFGRTGHWFAFQGLKVTPDVLCLGKGMSGGFPISVCMSSKKIFNAWGKSVGEAKHTSTFLGHPIGCAMVVETIQSIKKHKFLNRVNVMGKYLSASLEKLLKDHPDDFKSVRGRGLMYGLECHHPKQAKQIVQNLLQSGILVLGSGEHSQVITFTPPFTITQKDIKKMVTRTKRCLSPP